MPMMSDNRRRKIVAKQRKLENANSRAAKIAKKELNASAKPKEETKAKAKRG